MGVVEEPRFFARRTMDASDRVRVPLVCALVVGVITVAAIIADSRLMTFVAVGATLILLPYTAQAIVFAGKELWSVEATKDYLIYRRVYRKELRVEREAVASVRFIGKPGSENGNSIGFDFKNRTELSMPYLETDTYVGLSDFIRMNWAVVTNDV